VRSKFKKESNSGTSVAFDPDRSDPIIKVQRALGDNSIRDDPLYLTVRFTSKILIHSNQLSGPKDQK
jgi:hypothetical protein